MTERENKARFTKEFLEHQYLVLSKTCIEIAEENDTCSRTVLDYLIKFDIPRREAGYRPPPKDILGQKIGAWTPIEYVGYSGKSKVNTWRCQCECGIIRNRTVGTLSTEKKLYSACRHQRFQKIGRIPVRYMKNLQKNAVVRNLEFNITGEYLDELFTKQNGRCALSDIELSIAKTSDELDSYAWTASVDRIDSNIGYIEGNVQWIHKHLNIMKSKYDEGYFIEMCIKVASNEGRKRWRGSSANIPA